MRVPSGLWDIISSQMYKIMSILEKYNAKIYFVSLTSAKILVFR